MNRSSKDSKQQRATHARAQVKFEITIYKSVHI